LASATDRFSKDRIIGNGFFSTVYKGIYTDENGRQEVAVKKITVPEYVGAELQKINTTRHKNIVKLKGWCCNRNIWNLIGLKGWSRKEFVFLVYEFVPNGNLYDHLHHKEETLPWEKRYCVQYVLHAQ
jgi:serine/threonine protein kinase